MKKYFFIATQGAGLVLTILPSLLVFQGTISNAQNKQLMLLGLILWFGTALLKTPAKK